MIATIKAYLRSIGLDKIEGIVDYIYLKSKGVETKMGYVTLSGWPIIMKYPGSVIKLGKGVILNSSRGSNIAGINHPVILATLSKAARIEFEDGSGASGSSIVSVKSIIVGKHADLGVNSCLYDTDFHSVDPYERRNQKRITQAASSPIIIGDDVWIGANAIILKGVEIARGAVVGAGSVVTRNIKRRQIVAGNPAKVIRKV